MIIREAQLEAMKPLADSVLYKNIYDHVRNDSELDITSLSEKELMSVIKKGVDKGRSYGLTWCSSLTAFVALTILISPNFDQYPPAQQILTDEKIEANERPVTLADELTEEQWKQATFYK